MADVETEREPGSSSGAKGGSKKKFEVKKWNAVALWAWGAYNLHISCNPFNIQIRYCGGQLCHLQKSHYGSMYVYLVLLYHDRYYLILSNLQQV